MGRSEIVGSSADGERAAVRAHGGFTLIEVLVAMAILTVALLGVAGAVALQSGAIASSIPMGQAAVSRGHHVSTAAMLAQQRLEDVKRLQYTLTTDEFGAGTTPTGFPDENPVTGSVGFQRQVRVLHNTPVTNMKTITVTVIFTIPTERGLNRESIVLRTLVAARSD